MRNPICYIVIFIFIQISCIRAQYQSVYSNYLLNIAAVNPAAIGRNMALETNLSARKQWSGFSGSPSTNYISANTMVKKPSMNLGLMIQTDKIAVASTQSFYGLYAYRMRIKKINIAFGLQAGVQLYNENLDQLIRVDQTDALVGQNPNKSVRFLTGSGIYVHNHSFFAGLSSPSLYNSGRKFNFNSSPLLLNFGLTLKARKTDLIKPSIMIRRIKGSDLTTDLNLTYYFYSKYGIGVSYRIKNAIVAMMEIVLIDQLKISYCYDYSINAIAPYQNGSHEISFRYLFGKQVNIKNPRALTN